MKNLLWSLVVAITVVSSGSYCQDLFAWQSYDNEIETLSQKQHYAQLTFVTSLENVYVEQGNNPLNMEGIHYRINHFEKIQGIENKLYIQPEMICLRAEHIFFIIGTLVIPIQTLSVDEKGVYISLEEIKNGFFGDTWICLNCGYENYDCIQNCGICGKSRYPE